MRLFILALVCLALSAPALAGDPPPVIGEVQSVSKFYACGERVLAFMIEGMQWPPVIKLVKDGQPDIVAEHMNFDWPLPDGQMQCVVDIVEGTAGGMWSLVITNPDSQSVVLPDAVEVVSTCPRGRVGDFYVANEFGKNGVDIWFPEGPKGPAFGNTQHGHGNVLQFDGVTGDFVCNFAFGAGEDDEQWLLQPYDLEWGPNGNLFVCDIKYIDDIGNVTAGGKVNEYDGRTGAYVRTFVPIFRGGMVMAHSMAFGGPDGNLYVLNNQNTADGVFEYDGQTGEFVGIAFKPFAGFGLDTFHLAFGPSGNMLLTAGGSGTRPTFIEMRFNSETGQWELERVIRRESGFRRKGFLFEADVDTWICGYGAPDDGADRIDRESGEVTEIVIPDPPSEPGVLLDPWDLACGPTKDLFVCGTETSFWDGTFWGALHQYDTTSVPFEQIRVYAETHDPGIEGEVWQPRSIEFKPLPGDCGGKQAGGDWDVNLDDCARFFGAFTGPGVRSADVRALVAFDDDRDGDIDYADFGAFQRHFGKTVDDYR